MTAKQKAARAKFKAVVKEAGKLRKKNPKLTQAEAVKQAWAIFKYKEEKNPINKIKKYIKKAKEDFEEGYYGKDYKKKKNKKICGTKTHKDTKSHNVNIRVMSGIENERMTFWIGNFAPRKRSLQLEWYKDLRDAFKYNDFKNLLGNKEDLLAQLRALEYILNKKPLKIN